MLISYFRENGPPFYMEVAPDFKYSSYLNLQFNKCKNHSYNFNFK